MRRLQCEKAAWHVFARGTRRLVLYRDEQDFLRFLSILAYALAESGASLWAYCLMSNHYHLVIYATSKERTACMRRVNHLYSLYHNDRYGLSGHAFDGPYQALRLGYLCLLLQTIAYVFANPVSAGMVDYPEEYPWSSYKNYRGITGSALDVNPTAALSFTGGSPLKGMEWFKRALAHELSKPKDKTRLTPTAVQMQADQFEWLLKLARERESDLAGEDPMLVAMYWAHQVGVPPRAIARTLGDVSGSAIRARISRFAARIEKDSELSRRVSLP